MPITGTPPANPVSSAQIPDPYTPPDGTWNVTGIVRLTSWVETPDAVGIRGEAGRASISFFDNGQVYGLNNGTGNPGFTWGAGAATHTTWETVGGVDIMRLKSDALEIVGGILIAFAAKTAAYTVTDADFSLTGDPSGAAFTFTLPTAVGRAGKIFTFKKLTASVNAITIDGSGAETIDGAATLVIATQNSSRMIQSDGANWIIIGSIGAL